MIKQQDLTAKVANLTGTDLSRRGVGFDQVDTTKPFNAELEAGKVGAALNESAEKLVAAGDINVAINKALDGQGMDAAPAQVGAAPSQSEGIRSAILGAGGMLGLGLIGGPVGAGIGLATSMVSAVNYAISPTVSGPDAGIHQHAALQTSPSSFASYGSSGNKGKDKDPDADSVYSSFGTPGMGAQPNPAMQQQRTEFSNPLNTRYNRQLQEAANYVVAQEGMDKIREQISGQHTNSVKDLMADLRSAQQQAEQVFGVQTPGLEQRVAPPQIGMRSGMFGMS